MATILTKKSDTASSVPSAAQLTNSATGAELAVNTADKRLYTKDSGGNVVEVGTNPSTFSLPSGTANAVPYLNGSKVLTTGSALTFDGTNFATTGTATATKLTPTGNVTAGNGMYLPATNTLAFSTNGSERLRIDSSGNVGIGTSSPVTTSARLSVKAVGDYDAGLAIGSNASAANWARLDFKNTNAATSAILYQDQAGTFTIRTDGAYPITFATNGGNERARITADGEVYIAGTVDQGAYNLQVNGTGVWGAGAYVNGSDARLKENVQTLTDGLSVVTQLRPVTFQYKADYSKDTAVQPGFIAQELQQAMAGKDYVDGVVQAGPEYLNVAYQSLIPVLTAAIQELNAKVEALTAEIQTLKGN